MKRLLDCTSSDFAKMSKDELLYSIAASEGRVLLCESIGAVQPMLGDITNAEFTASMGADILLLNMFDVDKPVINGLPKTEPQKVISKIKELTGRPVGINLEPVQNILPQDKDSQWSMTKGRKATLENAQKAADMGVDMILLTGNPGVGVTNQEIIHTLQIYKKELGDKVILAAGKMHASGILTEAAENITMITRRNMTLLPESNGPLDSVTTDPYDEDANAFMQQTFYDIDHSAASQDDTPRDQDGFIMLIPKIPFDKLRTNQIKIN